MNKLLLIVPFLLAAAAPAQLLAPLAPSGQPVLMPFVPMAVAPLPPPVVWAVGNPGFALASFAPLPVPPGLPTFLVLGPAVPPIPVFPPLVFAGFGVAMLTNMLPVVIPAGPSGPAPGPLVPFPIPPTGGPIGMLTVHTLVFAPGGLMLSGALGITI